ASFFDDQFRAARLGRRHEDAVGSTRNAFFGPEYAYVGLDLVVVGGHVFVGDGPVVAHAVGGARFEIDGSKAQCDPSPVICASADDARAEPAKARSCRYRVRLAG